MLLLCKEKSIKGYTFYPIPAKIIKKDDRKFSEWMKTIREYPRSISEENQTMNLPNFKYHPDPVSSGSIIQSDAKCLCCGKVRGYIYTSNIYCVEELENEICPWCIADGSAARKFNATFCDDYPLQKAGMHASIIQEVTTKTPGYDSWQQEVWLTHCNDACAFLGDASKADVLSIASDGLQVEGGEWIDANTMSVIAQNYQPKLSPAFYKFKCLHCDKIMYAVDFD